MTSLLSRTTLIRPVFILVGGLFLFACDPKTPAKTTPKDTPRTNTPTVKAPVTPKQPPPVTSTRLDEALIAKGKARMQHFECNRCHDGAGFEPAPLDKHCVQCHHQILTDTYTKKTRKELLTKWKTQIKHLHTVPTLEKLDERFRRDWLVSFLQEPHDIRPELGAMMPRLDMSREDAEAIAAYLMPHKHTKPKSPTAAGDAKRGKSLLDTMGCGACHVMTGSEIAKSPIPVSISKEQLKRGKALAPDLAVTRKRFRPDALVRWLQNPKKVKPDTSMPVIPLNEQEARDVAAYLLEAPMMPPSLPIVPKRLPILTRPVKFAEVQKKVFHKVCWHCHSEADFVRGDGGPGNTGGFGFKPRKLSLADYASISSGMLDHDGNRKSVFLKGKDGTPHIVAAMHARHAEIVGKPVPGIRGMPLGLPPMTLEEIQLVETWVFQGRPR